MVFKHKNGRHRLPGKNAFDKKISQGLLKIAGISMIVCSGTAAYAVPQEVLAPAEKVVEADVIVPDLSSTAISAVKIPAVTVAVEKTKDAEVVDMKIEVIPKPEPVVIKPVAPEILETTDEAVNETIVEVDDSSIDEKTDKISENIKSQTDETITAVTGFAAPLSSMSVSSSFGYRIHPVYGTSKLHEGLDLSGSCGTPVYASADGKVVQSGHKNSRAGNIVELDHGTINGEQVNTNYYHLSTTSAVEGSVVKQGDLIGEIGSTGTSTGCHLHWGMTINGEKVDPSSRLNN